MSSAAAAAARLLPFVALLLATLSACGSAIPPDRRVVEGDPLRGRQLIAGVGCGVCHQIPGVDGANGIVGPSLEGVGRRNLLAGVLPNQPDVLTQWVRDAPSLRPETGMPEMPLSEEEAEDVAAYLYTLR
ncbi:MAG TPA: c-type cytochrome [Devosiaceae bacterium]|jgi:mono/diheme cytochrome c family protein|nr:c-type cytochrome [Devosiaceae bacterium]